MLGVCGVRGEVERGEDGGIFKWGGIKRRMERAAECFPKNEIKMIRKKN